MNDITLMKLIKFICIKVPNLVTNKRVFLRVVEMLSLSFCEI